MRYFNAAGADPDGDLAELHVPETHLIPLAILAATGRHPPIQVFGESVGTPDGTCIRDYVHVADLARGHVQALDHLKLNAGYDAFNFGSERGYSILEVFDSVRRATGFSVPFALAPAREGDPPFLVADAGYARTMIGFQPENSSLDRMVKTAAFALARETISCALARPQPEQLCRLLDSLLRRSMAKF